MAIPASALGVAVRHEWSLDPHFLTVNHGSFGATPRTVLAAQDEWRRRLEAQPTRFLVQELPTALRQAAAQLAAFVGAAAEELAFVVNATTGCNAVLRSLRLAPGDEILHLGHVYGAVRNTIEHVAERSGARVVRAGLDFPRPDAPAILESLSRALSRRTRLAVLDHIASASALVLPIRDMVRLCQSAGVPVLVDGAHGPGQVALDLAVLGADWYVGNCHKWLMAPKGCAFLHARADRQTDLHPVTISHGFRQGFVSEFDWTGTADPSAFLAVTEALAFFDRLGGAGLMSRNAALAAEGAALLATRLGTEVGARPEMAGAMGLVRLPLSLPQPAIVTDAARVRQALLAAGTDAPVSAIDGALWLRVSAAAYNDISDYERLAGLLRTILERVR
jgi:isopenicillin-N epimerase